MSFFNGFPNTRTYDSDLGWLIKHVGGDTENINQLLMWETEHKEEYEELADKVEGLINNLVDVIVPWDSSIAYHVFSIVEYQGVNYIAVQDVPIGAMITNTDYWQPANTVVEQINAIGTIVSDLQQGAIITPEKYGAAGDGVTDDTAAFQAAINEAYTINGSVYAEKVYLITTTLNVPCALYDHAVSIIFNKIIYSGNDYAINIHGASGRITGNVIECSGSGSGIEIGDATDGAAGIVTDINTIITTAGNCCKLTAAPEHNVQDIVIKGCRWLYGNHCIFFDMTNRYVGEVNVYGIWMVANNENAGFAIYGDCTAYGMTGLNLYGVSFEGSHGAIKAVNTSTTSDRTFSPIHAFGIRTSEMNVNQGYDILNVTGNGRIWGEFFLDIANLTGFVFASTPADVASEKLNVWGRIRSYGRIFDHAVYVGGTKLSVDYNTSIGRDWAAGQTFSSSNMPQKYNRISGGNTLTVTADNVINGEFHFIGNSNDAAITINGVAFTLGQGGSVTVSTVSITGVGYRLFVKKSDGTMSVIALQS